MRILKFKLWWRFWHYRKFYTTTSALTYSLPTFSALKGLLAAILWFEKDSYNQEFSNVKLWIKLLNSVQKHIIWLNFLNKPENIKKGDLYTQIKFEILLSPSYEIFVADENFKYFDDLVKKLSFHRREYTPYLGVAFFIANIRYVWIFETKEQIYENVEVSSIISFEKLKDWSNLIIKKNQMLEIENLPYAIDSQRNCMWLRKVIFDSNGSKISLKQFKWFKVGDDIIDLI